MFIRAETIEEDAENLMTSDEPFFYKLSPKLTIGDHLTVSLAGISINSRFFRKRCKIFFRFSSELKKNLTFVSQIC